MEEQLSVVVVVVGWLVAQRPSNILVYLREGEQGKQTFSPVMVLTEHCKICQFWCIQIEFVACYLDGNK